MSEKRRITLRRERLSELSSEALGTVIGLGAVPAESVVVGTKIDVCVTGCGCFGSCGPGCTAISSHPA